MLSYLQKFNNLSKELRNKVSTQAVMFAIEELEKKYKVNLAGVVMKVMVKDIDIDDLPKYFVSEFKLDSVKAEQLAEELKEKALFAVADYLDEKKEVKSKLKSSQGEFRTTTHTLEKSEAKQRPRTGPSLQRENSFFSSEDEKEIKELAKKIDNDFKKTDSPSRQIKEKLDKIIAQTQINFGSELLAERFRQILKIYIRGIRDRINTKQTLIKPFEAGGLNFDQESAEQILLIADNNLKDLNQSAIKQPAKIKTPDLEKEKITGLKDAGVRDVDYDLAALANKEVSKKKIEMIGGNLDTEHELAPPPPTLRRTSSHVANFNKQSLLNLQKKTSFVSTRQDKKASSFSHSPQEADPQAAVQPSIAKKEAFAPEVKTGYKIQTSKAAEVKTVSKIKQIDARQPVEAMGKIKMEDVKFKPRVMGPIDELKYMDLISFRHLDKDPVKIVSKIKEKINLLEEESYAKRLEGIKAWRISPVNKLYLQMGHVSINENKPINSIIEERKAEGKDYLNSQEFKAITDLNKDLRF